MHQMVKINSNAQAYIGAGANPKKGASEAQMQAELSATAHHQVSSDSKLPPVPTVLQRQEGNQVRRNQIPKTLRPRISR